LVVRYTARRRQPSRRDPSCTLLPGLASPDFSNSLHLWLTYVVRDATRAGGFVVQSRKQSFGLGPGTWRCAEHEGFLGAACPSVLGRVLFATTGATGGSGRPTRRGIDGGRRSDGRGLLGLCMTFSVLVVLHFSFNIHTLELYRVIFLCVLLGISRAGAESGGQLPTSNEPTDNAPESSRDVSVFGAVLALVPKLCLGTQLRKICSRC